MHFIDLIAVMRIIYRELNSLSTSRVSSDKVYMRNILAGERSANSNIYNFKLSSENLWGHQDRTPRAFQIKTKKNSPVAIDSKRQEYFGGESRLHDMTARSRSPSQRNFFEQPIQQLKDFLKSNSSSKPLVYKGSTRAHAGGLFPRRDSGENRYSPYKTQLRITNFGHNAKAVNAQDRIKDEIKEGNGRPKGFPQRQSERGKNNPPLRVKRQVNASPAAKINTNSQLFINVTALPRTKHS